MPESWQERQDRERPAPSLNDTPPLPFGWIQWKGTNVCMDFHCSCGAMPHVDADFCYYVKCGNCGQVYECGGYIKLYPIAVEPEGTITERDDRI